jgi:hypothetical protein
MRSKRSVRAGFAAGDLGWAEVGEHRFSVPLEQQAEQLRLA